MRPTSKSQANSSEFLTEEEMRFWYKTYQLISERQRRRLAAGLAGAGIRLETDLGDAMPWELFEAKLASVHRNDPAWLNQKAIWRDEARYWGVDRIMPGRLRMSEDRINQ